MESYRAISDGARRFWKRWSREYIIGLRQEEVKGRFSVPRVGNYVLIHSDKERQLNWKESTVVEIIKGRDGVVRAARVYLRGGGCLERPARCLYLLGREDVAVPT